MTFVYHNLSFRDRLAQIAIRIVWWFQVGEPLGPKARPAFDEVMRLTPAVKGIKYERGTVGGVPGSWCLPSSLDHSGVMLFLHGGAFVLGSSQAYCNFVGQYASRAKIPAFIPDYSLAPEFQFPNAIDDAYASYRGLVELGHDRIVVVGDSAGGNLVLSLLSILQDDGFQHQPLGATVVSPWTDLALTGHSMKTRARADPVLNPDSLDAATSIYLGSKGDRFDAVASPLYADLSSLPPILIHVGEDEILLDDSLRYAHRLTAANGRVVVHIWQGMTHVFCRLVGKMSAASEALEIAGDFLQRLLR